MAKTPRDTIPESETTAVGEITIPDKASLGWSPADDDFFIHINEQETIGEFYVARQAPNSTGEGSVVEFTVPELSPGELLADLDYYDAGFFDLGHLLEQSDVAALSESVLLSSDLHEISEVSEVAGQGDSASPDFSQMSADMAFAQLTIVIDDESGSDTVAL